MTISDAQSESYVTAVEHGWWDYPEGVEPNFGEKIALMHTELSEALEEWRDGHEETYFGEGGKPEGVQIELADCVIRIMDWFGYKGWDLEQAMRLKMDYNKQREYRHGGKRA